VHTNPHRRSTIYDLSNQTGLSAGTISAILNGTWEKRRISAKTAREVIQLANAMNYVPNRQAQGLRQSASSMVGLIIPSHDSRFFAAIAQRFEQQVRQRNRCPIVVCAGRDPEREKETVRTLISYSIDSLVICGAADPDGLHDICQAVNLPHVNIDLPGTKAPSVISDNYVGGRMLAKAIIESLGGRKILPNEVHFFGGSRDASTLERVRGFEDILKEAGGKPSKKLIHLHGYGADATEKAFRDFYLRHRFIPKALLINGPSTFEGFLRFIYTDFDGQLPQIKIGCYDYDPLASFSEFKPWMVRQNLDEMVGTAFRILDENAADSAVYRIAPQIIEPGTILRSQSALT
jgi:LacI family fructose operon transcriptional repressor